MNTMATIITGAAAGWLLGMLHFGGLWWSLLRLPRARRPALWLGGSLLARGVLSLAALHALFQLHWITAAAALLGLAAARLRLQRRVGVASCS